MGKVSSIDDRKILIYRHRRLDTGKIFYLDIYQVKEIIKQL